MSLTLDMGRRLRDSGWPFGLPLIADLDRSIIELAGKRWGDKFTYYVQYDPTMTINQWGAGIFVSSFVPLVEGGGESGEDARAALWLRLKEVAA